MCPVLGRTGAIDLDDRNLAGSDGGLQVSAGDVSNLARLPSTRAVPPACLATRPVAGFFDDPEG
jgi:hypothetical protein